MKELVFHCDLHLARGETVSATRVGVPVTIGTVGPVLIDVCQRCFDETFDALIQTLAKYGYQEEKPKKVRSAPGSVDQDAGPFECKIPGCNAPPLKNRGSLSNHTRRGHGMTLTDYVTQYGEPVPVTSTSAA